MHPPKKNPGTSILGPIAGSFDIECNYDFFFIDILISVKSHNLSLLDLVATKAGNGRRLKWKPLMFGKYSFRCYQNKEKWLYTEKQELHNISTIRLQFFYLLTTFISFRLTVVFALGINVVVDMRRLETVMGMSALLLDWVILTFIICTTCTFFSTLPTCQCGYVTEQDGW